MRRSHDPTDTQMRIARRPAEEDWNTLIAALTNEFFRHHRTPSGNRSIDRTAAPIDICAMTNARNDGFGARARDERAHPLGEIA